ncbi:MAG: right-handed parallel beta-helix repeat-containing protein [Candidatus Altiarchaeota archaeon]|nr:right-handed parallel beta-helix repeat-containing protein [Candidatus Altiarchaeota archaeon]
MKKIIIAGVLITITVLAVSNMLWERTRETPTPYITDCAATYYIDAGSGKDTNDGLSPNNAWQSINKINSITLDAGDRVFFKRGERWSETLIIQNSGTETLPIVFGAYGVGPQPLISAEYIDSPGFSLMLKNTHHVVIEDMHFADAVYACVLIFDDSTNVTIRKNTVTGCGPEAFHSGICIWGGSNNTITLNNVTSCADGIAITGYDGKHNKNNVISHNTITDIDGAGINLNQDPKENIIEHNLIHHACLTVDDRAGIYTHEAGPENIIRYNTLHSSGTNTTRCAGINIDYFTGPSQIYYNTIHNNSAGGIAIASSNHKVYNNVMFHNNEYDYDVGEIIMYVAGASIPKNNTVKNNILAASKGRHLILINGVCTQNHRIDFNMYYPGNESIFEWNYVPCNLTSWSKISTHDKNSLAANPGFIDESSGDFRVDNTSLCIDSGTDAGLDRDLFGNTVPYGIAPDIGIFESCQ